MTTFVSRLSGLLAASLGVLLSFFLNSPHYQHASAALTCTSLEGCKGQAGCGGGGVYSQCLLTCSDGTQVHCSGS
jgi:hypothetical protein